MQITFGLGATRQVYEIVDWSLEYADGRSIVCRPGFRTFFRRLFLAVLIALLAAGMLLPVRGLHDPVLQPLRVLAGVLVGFAVLYAVSAAWQRIRISGSGDCISVRTFCFLPRSHSWAISSLVGMNILEQEVRSSMKSGHRRLGWRWRVLVNSEAGGFEFWCDHQRERCSTVPLRVTEFARQLQQLSGLSCGAPQTIEWRSGRQGAFRTGRRITAGSPLLHKHQEFHSLEEMPPEIRARAEAAMAQMRAEGRSFVQQERITIRDSEGNVRSYNSVDEMPADVRRRYESARRAQRELGRGD